jgi:hypothetical protein
MQVGVHRDDTIDGVHYQLADGSLADSLTCVKSGVLTHVTKIWSQQYEAFCTLAA